MGVLAVFVAARALHTGHMRVDGGGIALVASFDEVVLPHLDAGYRLARWLMRNEADAEDAVQDASLRAFRYFRTFSGGNGRAWFLRIVRNTCCGWRGGRLQATSDPFDEEQHSTPRPASNPETLLLQTHDVALIEDTMHDLPDRFREVLVLRELEGLSYRELADVTGTPMGTVMSRLSRARQAFRIAFERRAGRCGVRRSGFTAAEPPQIRRALDRSDPTRPRTTCHRESSVVPEILESSASRSLHPCPKPGGRTD